APGRLPPANAPAEFDRLAGHDLRTGVADLHRVRVVDPRHRLLIGPHVGGHDVHPRADDREYFLGVTPGQPFLLPRAQQTGVAGDPALRPGERQVHDPALPTHPHGERRHLTEVHVRGVPQAALARAAG